MDWKLMRFQLFRALDSLEVHDIFLIEKEEKIISICIVVSGLQEIRPMARFRLIDKLIEKNEPDLYAQFLFCYEIWDKKDWDIQPVAKVWIR